MRRAMEADIAIDGAASIDTLGWSSMKLRAKEIFYRSSPHAKLSFLFAEKNDKENIMREASKPDTYAPPPAIERHHLKQ